MSDIKVSLTEDLPPPAYGAVEERSAPAANGGLEGKERELAVSFHSVEYVINTHCGRKTKTILGGVR